MVNIFQNPTTKSKSYKKEHKKFCDKYRLYQEEHGIDGLKLEDAIKKIKQSPYDQYKEDPIEGVEPLKNEKLARKNKTRKYIKKIKIQNLKGDEELSCPEAKMIENTIESDKGSAVQNTQNEKINTNNPFRIS